MLAGRVRVGATNPRSYIRVHVSADAGEFCFILEAKTAGGWAVDTTAYFVRGKIGTRAK